MGGLALVVGLALLDVAWGPEAIIIVTVLLGPLIAALRAPPRDVAVVAVAAAIAALLSGAWNDNFGDGAYWLRLLVVAVGGMAALARAAQRESAQEGRRRFRLLVALADVGEGALTLDETVQALTGILVPEFADVCILDLLQGDEPVRLGVKASGADAEVIEAWLRDRPPAEAGVEVSSRTAARTRRVHVVARIDPDTVAAWSVDSEDAERMRALAPRSSMVVPLLARGRMLGTLSLTVTERSGRSYTESDAAFAEVLAGRVALALDNAGLYAELQTAEAQLSASLESLADAVIVEAPGDRLLHANAAAVRQLGFGSAQELLSRRPDEVLARFELFGEDRRPLTGADVLAAARVFAGEVPEPLLIRHVERETREEGWSIVKSTPVTDRDGRPRLAVHVIEDVTALKRAEAGQRLLVRAGRVLTSSMQFERTLQEVTELVVPALADWCTISLPDAAGHLRQVAVAHADPERVRFAWELDERHPPRLSGGSNPAGVMRDGGSRRVNGITAEQLRRSAEDEEHYRLLTELGLYAGLAVPLVARGEPLGVMTLASAESRRPFSDADVLLAEQLGRLAGTAVHTGRLYAERSSIAATLQTGLLPPELPAIPGWTAVPLYRPAGPETWVGGDFYDAFPVRGGWMVIVGDVA
ncbi:MAG TPA: GAF domain-containing protein, partial [Solirubrobacteraceae bacterium]|nr:GAF domain-containing protein [Solirubrobacteraceae bacterium]